MAPVFDASSNTGGDQMSRSLLPLVVAPLALLALVAACSDGRSTGDKGESASTPAATNAAVHIHRDRDFALDPTMPLFHLAIDAAGPTVDSLTVKLQIRTPDQKLVYDRTWPSAGYLDCECDDSQRPAQLPGLRADAQRYLETFFDSAFVPPVADSGRYWEQPDHRMSELLQLVPQLWDVKDVRDTAAVFDSISADKPTSYDALADQVRAGIRKRPAIVYRTALEGYCISAWSPEVGRIVDVLCGP
jgi:hypothetical protein